MARCSQIAGRVWLGHCCARGSEDAAVGCTMDSVERLRESLGEACNRIATNMRVVCVYGSKKRWKGVRGMQVAVSALGEGEDPVNMEDANIGLGKRSGSLPGMLDFAIYSECIVRCGSVA